MIAIRAAHPGDAGAIAAIYAAEVTGGTATFETVPPTEGEILTRMASAGGRFPWLVAVGAEGSVLGYAYAAPFHARAAYDATVETSVYLAPASRGAGVGRRLYATLLDALTTGGFAQVIGRIALPNAASVAVHEALGFRAAGVLREVGFKHGRRIDVGFWQRALGVADQPPPDPR